MCDLEEVIHELIWEEVKRRLMKRIRKQFGEKFFQKLLKKLATAAIPGIGTIVSAVTSILDAIELAIAAKQILNSVTSWERGLRKFLEKIANEIMYTFGGITIEDNECACEAFKQYIRDLARGRRQYGSEKNWRKRKREAKERLWDRLIDCARNP